MRYFYLLLAVILLAGCSSNSDNAEGPDIQDSTVPVVSITRPIDGNVLGKGVEAVRVSAVHPSGIKFVQIKIGLKDIRYDYEAPYDFPWIIDPSVIPPGNYQICALAVDSTDHSAQTCITVTVAY